MSLKYFGSAARWVRVECVSRAGAIVDDCQSVNRDPGGNGIIGGATGLAGIAAVVWCNLRGWAPAEQRAVFQPIGVATFVMIALWLGSTDMIGTDTAGLFLLDCRRSRSAPGRG